MRLALAEKPATPGVSAAAPVNPWAAVPPVVLAGCVDAIGWLRFDQLFVRSITGTSIMPEIAAAEGHAGLALALGTVVGLSTVGALAGAVLGGALRPR